MGTNPLHNADYEVFALLLRSTREKAGVTQIELANRMGMEQSTISKIEKKGKASRRDRVAPYLHSSWSPI